MLWGKQKKAPGAGGRQTVPAEGHSRDGQQEKLVQNGALTHDELRGFEAKIEESPGKV